MEISENLRKLAKEFNKTSLYIVGGYVRDSLLGYIPNDIDIASSMPTDDVIKICKKLKFKCNGINKKLGTLSIVAGDETYEYTTFRRESYSQKNHTPDIIEFVDDIVIDCMRRDITINSIYYDINQNKIVDPANGQKHLQEKNITTTNTPEITLSDDGLRILRLIRFASVLNFKISKSSYKCMNKFSYLLKNISKERIRKEIELLCSSDLKHNNQNKIFLSTIEKLKLLPFIFNSSLARISKFSNKDISGFYTLSENARLVGFYILIIKNYLNSYTPVSQLFYTVNMLLGKDGIKESNDTIKTTEKIYTILQNLQYNNDTLNASINYLTLSDCEREIINAYLNKKSKSTLSDNITFIKSKNLPLSVHELKICAEDLIKEKIEQKYISKILSTLYNQVIEMKVLNEKDDLIKLAKDIDKNFKQIIKENL